MGHAMPLRYKKCSAHAQCCLTHSLLLHTSLAFTVPCLQHGDGQHGEGHSAKEPIQLDTPPSLSQSPHADAVKGEPSAAPAKPSATHDPPADGATVREAPAAPDCPQGQEGAPAPDPARPPSPMHRVDSGQGAGIKRQRDSEDGHVSDDSGGEGGVGGGGGGAEAGSSSSPEVGSEVEGGAQGGGCSGGEAGLEARKAARRSRRLQDVAARPATATAPIPGATRGPGRPRGGGRGGIVSAAKRARASVPVQAPVLDDSGDPALQSAKVSSLAIIQRCLRCKQFKCPMKSFPVSLQEVCSASVLTNSLTDLRKSFPISLCPTLANLTIIVLTVAHIKRDCSG